MNIQTFLAKNLGVEATVKDLLAYFSDCDHVDLVFTAPQVAYIIKNFEPKRECYHLNVKIHQRLYTAETRWEPAEYEYKAECLDCGEWMDVEDVPDVATREEA